MIRLIFKLMMSIIVLLPVFYGAQLKLYEFKERSVLQHESTRSTVVFIYTDWCRYCENMKQTTFKQKKIIEELNQHFYTIFLNAEEKGDIFFSGKTYRFRPNGFRNGTHELAQLLMEKDLPLSFPAIIILNAENEMVFRHQGFLTSAELFSLLSAARTIKTGL